MYPYDLKRIVTRDIQNLPGLYITCQEIYDVTTGSKYLRYDLVDYNDEIILSINVATTYDVRYGQALDESSIHRLLFEFVNKSLYLLRNVDPNMVKSLKEYKDTVNAIDKLP